MSDQESEIAYPCMDDEDVVCGNCGYIIGWPSEGEPERCPKCGLKIDWTGWEI